VAVGNGGALMMMIITIKNDYYYYNFLIVGGFYSEVALQKREAEGTVRSKMMIMSFLMSPSMGPVRTPPPSPAAPATH
jgi:hypothetical protein